MVLKYYCDYHNFVDHPLILPLVLFQTSTSVIIRDRSQTIVATMSFAKNETIANILSWWIVENLGCNL